jgi:glycosyltransferase involved in cell wall biosynthesis
VKIRFLTSTPLDIARGSSTYVGIHVLAKALEAEGHTVAFEKAGPHLPVYTLERILFNRRLRPDPSFDLTVGFDMDGYRIAREPGHVASLKGVIADEVRFERGPTRLTMSMQAHCERLHVLRASRVLATSAYSAISAQEFYGLHEKPRIVPELISLAEWRGLLQSHPASSPRFTVLYVGRLYRRKRVDVLLRAVEILRPRLPELELRIVGNGPCAAALRAMPNHAVWLGDVSRAQLAAEYNRASVFCLPSVQEGFGIVLLEAMAAGKAIVGSRAGAIPETAPHAALVEPDNPEALAAALERLYQSTSERHAMAAAGAEWVEQFDAARVAHLFLSAATGS